MVPFNMVSEVHVDSPDVAERLLRDNTTTPPGPPSSRHPERGASRPPVGARSGHPPRHHRTGSLHRCTEASSSSSSQRRRVAKAALEISRGATLITLRIAARNRKGRVFFFLATFTAESNKVIRYEMLF